MRYTRLELRFLPRGWARGTLYTGAVGGKVLILGPSLHGLPENVPLLPDAGHGLNAALI